MEIKNTIRSSFKTLVEKNLGATINFDKNQCLPASGYHMRNKKTSMKVEPITHRPKKKFFAVTGL